MTAVTFDPPSPEIGQYVEATSENPPSSPIRTAHMSGVYRGVVRSEWDGQPIHFLTHGEINGHPQRCFGFPADGEPTTDETPSQIMARLEAEDAPAAQPPGGREVLVHLNVEVPEGDARSADEIADAILGALEVGSDDDSVRDLTVACPMAEEV